MLPASGCKGGASGLRNLWSVKPVVKQNSCFIDPRSLCLYETSGLWNSYCFYFTFKSVTPRLYETECYFKHISQVYETLSLWIIPPSCDPNKFEHSLHPSNGMAPCIYWTYFQGLFESNQSKYTRSETVLVLFNRLAICCGKVVISRRWHQLWITTSLKTSLTATLALNWRQMKATRLT